MKPITAEWISKAEGDFAMVERESRARKNPNFDGICFHAQQCAGKYLKPRLCESEISFSIPTLTTGPIIQEKIKRARPQIIWNQCKH